VPFIYRGIEYALRQGIGRDQWVLFIQYPDTAGVEMRFAGTRDAALEKARRRISDWLKRQREKSRSDGRSKRALKSGQP
jgi:hypothetical protein